MCDTFRNMQFCLSSDSKPSAYKYTRTIIIYNFEFYFEIRYLQYLYTYLKLVKVKPGENWRRHNKKKKRSNDPVNYCVGTLRLVIVFVKNTFNLRKLSTLLVIGRNVASTKMHFFMEGRNVASSSNFKKSLIL